MSTSRDNILNRIKAIQPGKKTHALPELIRPKINSDQMIQFREKLELGGGRLHRVKNREAAASLITGFLVEKELPMKLRLSPILNALKWDDSVEVSYGRSDGNDLCHPGILRSC